MMGRPLLLALPLAGCVIASGPPMDRLPPPPSKSSLPAPLKPSPCVEDWYAKAELPSCVSDWIVGLSKQQQEIAQKHKVVR